MVQLPKCGTSQGLGKTLTKAPQAAIKAEPGRRWAWGRVQPQDMATGAGAERYG